MTKEELLNKAIKIADKAHKGQTDKFGTPYIGHVMRVMNYGKTYDEKIVGVLHDVIEDCPEITLDYLLQQGWYYLLQKPLLLRLLLVSFYKKFYSK